MSFALNEVEAMARKASRGAGYSWGMAEEASKATRWLCAQGFDGCAALAQLLAISDGVAKTDMAPATPDGVWRAPSGPLCPLMAGVALSDFAYLLGQGEIRMQDVICPNLLLPFVAAAARQQGTTLTLDLDGVQFVTDGDELCRTRNDDAPGAGRAVGVRVHRGGSLQGALTHHSRATPDPAIWDRLNRLAGRTYAPSTEESRLLGAGAGLSDND